MARTHRLEELSILNVIFCMLVVLIHVLSHAVGNLDKTSWQYAIVLIPQRLAFVSVYGFFFLSGVKLTLPRNHQQSLGTYYWGRVKNLLLPYLLAAAIYYLFFVAIGWYTFSPAQFIQETALGTLSAPFYFLITLAQFILLAPLFQWISKRFHPALLLPLSLGITWLSSIYAHSIVQLFAPDTTFLYGDRIFTSYLIYYIAGCCAGVNYQRFPSLLEENRSLVTTSAIFFGTADGILSVLLYSGRKAVPFLELIHTLYIFSAIFALHAWAIHHKTAVQGSKAHLFHAVDRASYLIYLYHCLIITIFNILAPRLIGGGVSIQLLLRIAVVYPVTITGCILWQKLSATVRKQSYKTRIE